VETTPQMLSPSMAVLMVVDGGVVPGAWGEVLQDDYYLGEGSGLVVRYRVDGNVVESAADVDGPTYAQIRARFKPCFTYRPDSRAPRKAKQLVRPMKRTGWPVSRVL